MSEIYNGINIDRLHFVIGSSGYARKMGRTTAAVQRLIGCIELGESEFVLLLPNMERLKTLIPFILRELENRDIHARYKESRRWIEGVVPRFRVVFIANDDRCGLMVLRSREPIYIKID